MGISQRLTQMQKQQQLLRLSPQQLLVVKMLEMPVAELSENVKNELIDNSALEEGMLRTEDIYSDDGDEMSSSSDEFEAPETLYEYDSDDIPVGGMSADDFRQETVIGATKSFSDDLMEQMVDFDISDQQRTLVEYLIGSLDTRGFLTRSVSDIVDDLMIEHNIYTSEEEVSEALSTLQQFNPPGIAARNTQECLILQIDRKLQDENSYTFDKLEMLQDARNLLDRHYDLFINNNVEKLRNVLDMSQVHLNDVLDTIKKLDPHPGLALCESSSDRVQVAIPDFVVETDLEGNITFELNGGGVPSLHVSQEYTEMVSLMQKSGVRFSKHEKERLADYQEKLARARMYIESIRQRQNTLTLTMRAIINLQRKFFLSQDEGDLNKLILEDVAKKAGLDISTVSRVCSSKYALVDGTLYPLSFFFKRMRTNKEGEEIDGRKVEMVLQEIINSEDKRNPFSDASLVEELKTKGINIKIKTVNKYRNKLGIPTALKRKSV